MFDLPKSTAVNRIIPKNAFDVYANSRQKRLFSDKIEKIRWLNKLSPKTINLSGSDVHEIQIFEIELRKKDTVKEVLRTIDKAIPYHILFVLKFDDLRLLSSSEKHIHPANENLAVIDWTFNTDWFNISDNCYKFNLKQSLDFVFTDIIFQISGKPHAPGLNISELISKEQKVKQFTARLEKLKSEIKKCRQFNRKVELNMEMLECAHKLNVLNERGY